MGRLTLLLSIALALGLPTLGLADNPISAQQGGMGRINSEDSLDALNRALGTYLNGDEVKAILTPGEFNEWKLDMKAGEVILAEARSDAFDPGLEIVDSKGQIMAENDDRYPGDQRPLLIWRCEQDGSYALHVRCFRNKAGGQFFMRYKTWDSVDLGSGQMVDKSIDSRAQFLLRVPMKKGEMKTFVSESGGPHSYMGFSTDAIIAPGGLPDIDLTRQISSITRSFLAPVDGVYYVIANPDGARSDHATIRAGAKDFPAVPLAQQSGIFAAKSTTNTPTLWEFPVEKGEFLEISMPELDPNPNIVLAEVPNIDKYAIDQDKPALNPFYPQPADKAPANLGSPFDIFPGRARDNRILVFHVKRDTKLWLATYGNGPSDRQFSLTIRPAAADYVAGTTNTGSLQVGNYDYWAFDAKAGDVMTFKSAAPNFAEQLIVRDPDLNEIRHTTAGVDVKSDDWRMVVQKPGRYLVAVSCMGDGGAGKYSLAREVLPAKEFSKGSPAQAEIAPGQVQVWKFTARPNDPLYIHWISKGGYTSSVFDDQGHSSGLPMTNIDGANSFGILDVNGDRPVTYLIVLASTGGKGSCTIELSNLPGYRTGK